MTPRDVVRGLPELLVHATSAAVVAAVLVAVGQPIFTDDLWWHLAMGAQYAASGPWLDADPFLFAAAAAAEPAAWLADVGLHAVHRIGGFQALRVLHVVLVGATLWLGWSMLRRVGGSRVFASLGTAAFAAMSAYRFFQLRPHLFTILASLVLVRLLVVDRRPPSAARIAAAAAVLALWANAHGAFVLGLALIGAALVGAIAEVVLFAPGGARDGSRVRGLAMALGVGVLATCLNPAGPRFLLLYFTAGADTPELTVVADEWARVRLFAAPLMNVPPTPLTLALVWGLLVGTPLAVLGRVRVDRAAVRAGPGGASIDWALVAVSALSILGMLIAVRLLWMGYFALLAIAAALPALRGIARARRATVLSRVAAVAASAALLPAFLSFGDWEMISRGVQRSTYATPWSTPKYHAHGVWMLRDAGLEGRAWNDYWIGNFLSYWLTPEIRMFVNGSLNVPKDAMQAARDIRARRTDASGRTTPELLDAYGVDVFVGTGIPVVAKPGRPHPDTTRHLERTPGWIPVFRNVQTAVYLRVSDENRPNLDRVAAWYAGEGVPFDRGSGFDPGIVIERSPTWAVAHGLIPTDYDRLQSAARSGSLTNRRAAQERLSSIDVALGLYDRALARDARLASGSGVAIFAHRRRVWSLLHAGRIDEAVLAATRLSEEASPDDGLSGLIVRAARRSATVAQSERHEILARLPVFTRPQGQWVAAGFKAPEVRPGRR